MISQKELDFIESLKSLAQSLGRKPTRNEFREHLGYHITRFGSLSFTQLLELAGLPVSPNQKKTKIDPTPPKILLIDIETAPLKVFGYGLFDQNHSVSSIEEDVSVLSFAAKWLDNEEIIYKQVSQDKPRDDYQVVKDAFDLMNQADIIVAHNVNFDTKVLRGRWLYYNFDQERPFRTICTLQIARANFKLTSNKLEFLARYLGVVEKLDHSKYPGLTLFIECSKGNPDAFKHLADYNIRDIVTLEACYLKLRKYQKKIKFNVFYQDNQCDCGGKEFRKLEPIYTNTGAFKTFQCVDCGKVYRDTENLISSQIRKGLLK